MFFRFCMSSFLSAILLISFGEFGSVAKIGRITEEEDPLTYLGEIAINGECDSLIGLHAKLTSHFEQNRTGLPVIQDKDLFALLQITEERVRNEECSNFKNNPLIRFSSNGPKLITISRSCPDSSINDGWCDGECNTPEYQYDGGDCCPETCLNSPHREYPCGSGGYDCIDDRPIPVFFTGLTNFCFNWKPDNNVGYVGYSQCEGASQEMCAKVNEMTDTYTDMSNYRGGCLMRWKIDGPANGIPSWFKEVKICFRYKAAGDGSQCVGNGKAQNCAYLNSYTTFYGDHTDSREGGCLLSWSLVVPPNADDWMLNVALCFEWDGLECGGGIDKRVCATANKWTTYYYDNTGIRYSGCRMRWGLFIA